MRKQTKIELAEAIGREKNQAFKAVETLAIETLQLQRPDAFDVVQSAFEKYRQLVDEEEKVVKKLGRQYYHAIYVLSNCKNIKDIYFKLSPEIKALWNNIPELKAWNDDCR